MNTSNPEISVVIVSYNVQEYLCICLDSILSQKNILCEIIVVDNNSTDGTTDTLSGEYPTVKIITNIDNVGFSAANNQGIKKSSGEIIMLLNPDTELKDINSMHLIKDYMDRNPAVDILVPLLINTDGSFQASFWEPPGIKKLILELFYLHKLKKAEQPSSEVVVQAASGAALFFRQSLISEIGGLDENMFWMEDTDFCYRATEAGRKILFNPDIKIIHHGGKSSVENYSITIPNQIISRIKFSRKHDSKLVYFVINCVSMIFILSRVIIFAICSPINKTYNTKRKAYQKALKSYFRFNFKGDRTIIK